MAIFGDNSQGGSNSGGGTDRAWLVKVAAAEGGTINSAGAYFDASTVAGGSMKVLLYTFASANTPGTLVAASAGVSVPAGGGLVTDSMSGSFTTGDYFIGIVTGSYEPNVNYDNVGSGMDAVVANGSLSYASPPASWPGTDASYNYPRFNAYIDYTAAGGAISRLSLLGVG